MPAYLINSNYFAVIQNRPIVVTLKTTTFVIVVPVVRRHSICWFVRHRAKILYPRVKVIGQEWRYRRDERLFVNVITPKILIGCLNFFMRGYPCMGMNLIYSSLCSVICLETTLQVFLCLVGEGSFYMRPK